MSLRIEFLTVVVPIERIERRYPGGWEAFRQIEAPLLGNAQSDESLFSHSTMGQIYLMMALKRWKELGFRLHRKGKDGHYWSEVCVVESLGGPTMPCKWLSYDQQTGLATFAPKVKKRVLPR